MRRNVAMLNNIVLFSISTFCSQIVTENFDVDQLSNIRKVETLLKICIKKNGDILYLELSTKKTNRHGKFEPNRKMFFFL